ncbi:class-II fumarase/aspartase family protein [Paraburkholderia fungorum]|uniref:class-II fumarase/aspartase family protein n=1 Tax=Paraburkholderia fungorum TaxID=134537 RepID=UPI00248EE969|nr:adenylosuccinate lyase family protein [Paraburkholderia fungorum]
MCDIFSDRNMVQTYLNVEAAIARVQGNLGIIPEKAALEIVQRCRVETIDMAKLGARTGIVGFPIVGLVEQLVAACSDGWGEYAHWGATTQDIMDTADVLQFQDALKVLERDLDAVADQLVEIAKAHRDTVMVGRTHIQHALPVTFGYKAAVWLSSIDRHRKRLVELRPRLLVGQFSGAVGTLASLGDRGLEMQDALMDELGLGRPDITWHSARDSIAEVTGFLALVTGTLGKIGLDVILMSVTEVDEVKEPFVPGRGSSSTMPQKRNPVMSEMLVAIAKNVRQLHGTILDAMLNDHERGGAGPWQTEWPALPNAFILTGAALKHALELLGGVEVGRQRMRDNLGSTSGMISAEAVMMKLAPLMGRQRAHDVVYDCCREVERERISFLDALSKNSEIAAVAERDALAAMVDPTNYLGTATRMIDRLLVARAETACSH